MEFKYYCRENNRHFENICFDFDHNHEILNSNIFSAAKNEISTKQLRDRPMIEISNVQNFSAFALTLSFILDR